MTQELSEDFLRLCRSIKKKRAKVLIEHIIQHGQVTTEELEALYGYTHAPRVAGDARDLGIPIETIWVTSSNGRRIAAYRFGDITQVRADILAGRKVISKDFKQLLIKQHGSSCAVCLADYEKRYLQADHRVPFRIAGETVGERNPDDYMLLCGSDNRAKSWSCEHCQNWEERDINTCRSCYWAYPENYTHIAMRNVRRADVMWDEGEVHLYDKLKAEAEQQQKDVPSYIKEITAKYLEGGSS